MLRGDVVPQIAALKEEDGPEIQVHGSSNLIQTLLANDLVDEIHVMIFPVVVVALDQPTDLELQRREKLRSES